MGTGFFPGGKATGVMLIIPLHLPLRFRMSGALPLCPLYDFMARTEITVLCTFVYYSLHFLSSLLFTVITNFDPPIALLWNTYNVINIRTALYRDREIFLYK